MTTGPRMLGATALAATLSTALLAPTSSYAAAETCQGQAVTIVGTPQQPLAGTPGPDVIVTNGAMTVKAGEGDDLICITGDRLTFVDAGPGTDSVDATAVPPAEGLATVVTLGTGADAYLGSPGDDNVTTGDVPVGTVAPTSWTSATAAPRSSVDTAAPTD